MKKSERTEPSPCDLRKRSTVRAEAALGAGRGVRSSDNAVRREFSTSATH